MEEITVFIKNEETTFTVAEAESLMRDIKAQLVKSHVAKYRDPPAHNHVLFGKPMKGEPEEVQIGNRKV